MAIAAALCITVVAGCTSKPAPQPNFTAQPDICVEPNFVGCKPADLAGSFAKDAETAAWSVIQSDFGDRFKGMTPPKFVVVSGSQKLAEACLDEHGKTVHATAGAIEYCGQGKPTIYIGVAAEGKLYELHPWAPMVDLAFLLTLYVQQHYAGLKPPAYGPSSVAMTQQALCGTGVMAHEMTIAVNFNGANIHSTPGVTDSFKAWLAETPPNPAQFAPTKDVLAAYEYGLGHNWPDCNKQYPVANISMANT